jgi:hypothetical protein
MKKHGRRYTPEYIAWEDVLQRCRNERHPAYDRYGGRGITVCDRWLKFENFFEDMGSRPGPGYSLERKKNQLGYYKENCRWATRIEQNRNKRTNRMLTLHGETRCIAEWAPLVGLLPDTLVKRKRRGWSDEETLTRALR